MRKILIVNDDGIEAGGIIRLARAASKYGKVWVVAPDSQRSGASHSIKILEPISGKKVPFPVEGVEAHALGGTPADCARVGILNIVPGGPDVVLSGINCGYNVGSDVQYSGTVGAALEAAFQGVKAIALSEGFEDSYKVTDKYLDEVLGKVIDMEPGKNCIINVNFPTCKLEEVQGIAMDMKVSPDLIFKDHYDCTKISETESEYMIHGDLVAKAELGTDLRAVFDNYISIGTVHNLMDN